MQRCCPKRIVRHSICFLCIKKSLNKSYCNVILGRQGGRTSAQETCRSRRHAPSLNKTVHHVHHPSRAFSAECALAARFMLVKLCETRNGWYDIRTFVHHNDGAGIKTTLSILKRIVVHAISITGVISFGNMTGDGDLQYFSADVNRYHWYWKNHQGWCPINYPIHQ